MPKSSRPPQATKKKTIKLENFPRQKRRSIKFVCETKLWLSTGSAISYSITTCEKNVFMLKRNDNYEVNVFMCDNQSAYSTWKSLFSISLDVPSYVVEDESESLVDLKTVKQWKEKSLIGINCRQTKDRRTFS